MFSQCYNTKMSWTLVALYFSAKQLTFEMFIVEEENNFGIMTLTSSFHRCVLIKILGNDEKIS